MRGFGALIMASMPLVSVGGSCHKELTAEAIEKSPDAVPEQGTSGTSTWIVAPDGAVSATLKAPDGKPVMPPVTGEVTFASPGGAPASVPVHYEPKTGVLTAAGPALDADITPVRYTLDVGGAPWTGSIDVPRGGTHDLVATARLQPTGAVASAPGPNGGIVQTVGPDRVEVVASRNTGDVRAYVLDADNHPVDPGERRVTIAVEGEQPEVVVLAPEPQAHFLVGRLHARVDPAYLTVAVNARGTTHACLVGWSPGSVVVVGPRAPRVHLLAVDAWPGEVVEVRGGHGRHHGDVIVGSPGVVVGGPSVVVGAPSLVVETPGIVVGGPSVVVGGGVEAHGAIGGPELGHDRGHGDRDHDRGHGNDHRHGH